MPRIHIDYTILRYRLWICQPCRVAERSDDIVSRVRCLPVQTERHIIGQYAIRSTNNAEWRRQGQSFEIVPNSRKYITYMKLEENTLFHATPVDYKTPLNGSYTVCYTDCWRHVCNR